MMQTFTTIPFNAESGLWKANGIAKFSSAGIIFEFESKLIGLVSNGVKESRLPFDEVLDIRFRKGLFKRGARIIIRSKTLTALKDLPLDDGKLKLKIAPEDFDAAQKMVAEYQKLLSEETTSLPPTQTPVASLFDSSEDTTRELKNG
jgi:hypothetical protein